MRPRVTSAERRLRFADFPILPVAMTVLIVIATTIVFLAIRQRSAGHVWFTLDDPYIHLALAERIATRGEYGINPGEIAAPSSSILYPFILAILMRMGLGQSGPMLICFAATIASGLLFCAILREAGYTWRVAPAAADVNTSALPPGSLIGVPTRDPGGTPVGVQGAKPPVAGGEIDRPRSSAVGNTKILWPACLAAMVFVLGGNLIGLEFTGMEHALQVALALACVLGLLQFLHTQRVGRAWLFCAVAAPLIRYECASLWLGTILLLLWHGRFKPASLIGIIGLAGLGGFSVWLHVRGLAWLPSSVLAKLSTADITTGDFGAGQIALARVEVITFGLAAILLFAARLRRLAVVLWFAALVVLACVLVALNTPAAAPGGHLALIWPVPAVLRAILTYGVVQLFLLGILVAAVLPRAMRDRDGVRVQCALFGLFVLLAHAAVGRFGWLSRYEAYALLSGAAVAAAVWRSEAMQWARAAGWARQGLAATAVLLVMFLYVLRIFQAPATAEQVYDRQFQMHRFAVDFLPGPVAVNDLGLMSFRNPNVVLDLWGLGSEEARRARLSGNNQAWIDDLTRRHHVDLAIIYTDWFAHLPTGWRLAGSLETDGPNYGNAERAVDFYATQPQSLARVQAALARFALTLPPADHLIAVPPSRETNTKSH